MTCAPGMSVAEHRSARGLGRLQHAHIGGRPVGDDDRYRVDREQLAERLEEIGLLECGEMGRSRDCEDLDAVGMDEVEVPYERCDAGAVQPKLGRAAPPFRRSRRTRACRDCRHTAARR